MRHSRSAPGDRIALVGPSGSGKTSLLHLIAGLDQPSGGVIEWPALGRAEDLRPGPVAVAFQGPSLLPPLTVAENVALPALLAGRAPDAAAAAASAMIERLGLSEVASKLPEEISGGQAQRAGVARALVGEPRLILADEPTGQLDRGSALQLIDVLLEQAEALKAALVVATHDDAVAERLPIRWTHDRANPRDGNNVYVLTWLWGLLRRRTIRLAGAVTGVAIAVALLGSLGAFFAASKAHMTKQAAAGVVVDWQVQLTPGANQASAAQVIAATPGVVRSLPVGYAPTTGLTASAGGTVQTTGPGQVLGLPPGYAAAFPGEIRLLLGTRAGVLLAQQTAANLHATLGSMVSVGRPGQPPLRVRVQGIVDLPAADSLFQAVGVPAGAAPQAPPDNIVLLPQAQWQSAFAAPGRAQSAGVRTQYHVKLSSALPPDPAAAFADVIARAKNLEARLVGAGLVGNNLGAQLDAARSDALYAQLLFLLLGLPGAVLAALVTGVIGAAGADRRRREQALLRIRGASPRLIVRLAAAEALLVGVLGSAIGLAGAVIAGRVAFGATRFGSTLGQAIAWGALAAVAGLILALLIIAVPAVRDLRTMSVRGAREVVGPARRPLWSRLYLDLWLLAAAAVIFWQSVRSGYQVILAPEGVATISVSYSTFLAPAAVLDRGGAAVLASFQRGAPRRAGGPGPGGPAAGGRAVRGGGRLHVPAAAPAVPKPDDHGPDGLVRGLDGGVQHHLRAAVASRCAAHERGGRDRRHHRGGRPAGRRGGGDQAAARRLRGAADDAQVCLRRQRPAGHVRNRPQPHRPGHADVGRVLPGRERRRGARRPGRRALTESWSRPRPSVTTSSARAT